MRVYARREQEFQDSADYALKVTPAIIEEYEKFYKVPYPLPKLGISFIIIYKFHDDAITGQC